MIPLYVVQQQQYGPYQQTQDCLDRNWWHFLLSAGFMPILIPNDPLLAAQVLQQQLAQGALLTGGGEFCPHGTDARSATEIALLQWSLQTNNPVIGVCRGMQAMLQFCGGALEAVSGHIMASQLIDVGQQQRQVNSYHNFGCYQVPTNFRVTAIAADKVIKAVQATDRRWLGIMWHPERLKPFQVADQTMFYQFISGKNRCKP